MSVSPHLRTFDHRDFPPERVRVEREGTISACVPTRECGGTIELIVRSLVSLRDAGVLDQVVVIDADSLDGTAHLAAAAGADVHQQADLLPEHGPVLGKGDAMWRALSVLHGDIVCFLDGDSEYFGPHYACGVAGAVACEPCVRFAKGFYRRPFRAGHVELPEGGGRVTELTARPLLRRFYPELGAMRQPLAGEIAAPRELFERLPFSTGYAVETAMLIDAYREVGLEGMAQVDLEVRQNRHQTLRALGPMADAVLAAVAVRLEREGRLVEAGVDPPIERPPLATLAAS
jgi:glucosyl-3-phosphoglycerate synthase